MSWRKFSLAIYESALGPDDPDTVTALGNLSIAYWRLGQYTESLPLDQRVLQITEATLGPDHPSTALRLDNLAITYRDLGQADQALPLQQGAV